MSKFEKLKEKIREFENPLLTSREAALLMGVSYGVFRAHYKDAIPSHRRETPYGRGWQWYYAADILKFKKMMMD